MSYLRKIEYRMVPQGAYQIIRNCSGCGCKMEYHNTHDFRVNANGNQIDVWLIYQCSKCKHTYNLSIYERVRPNQIPKDLYQKFLANDRELAETYGCDKTLFARNKAEIDWEHATYQIEGTKLEELKEGDLLEIGNPLEVRVRTDKLVAELIGITRGKLKKMLQEGAINIEERALEKKILVQINKNFTRN